MIYCSLDPGLLILEGLSPHDLGKARLVIDSLILHNRKMEQCHAYIPMTYEMIQRVYQALNHIPIVNPPIRSPLKNQIIAILTRMVQPPLELPISPETILMPNITSDWISQETKNLWLDCLAASLFERLSKDEIELTISTWQQESLPVFVVLSSRKVCEYLEIADTSFRVPVLANEYDWDEFLCAIRGWPMGLESTLVESYARRTLGVPIDALATRRNVEFEKPCYREIAQEQDLGAREKIVEVVTCRAYNRLRPEHHDEIIEGQPGVHRVYVKKMAPAIRLHYTLGENSVIFALYSNGDHDRGLR